MTIGNLDKFWERVSRAIPMLGSGSDEEALAATRAVGRLLNGESRSFLDLAERVAGYRAPNPMPPAPPCAQTPSFGDMARACLDLDEGRLTQHERAFVLQMCRLGFSGRPSPRQLDWLTALFARLQRRAAA